MKFSEFVSESFFSFWPAILVVDLTRYLVAAGLMTIFLVLFARWMRVRKIQKRSATFKDVRREAGYSLLTVFIFSLVGFSVYVGSHYGVFQVNRTDMPTDIQFALELLALIILHDAYFYWTHRAMHHPRLFRRFHHVHHRSRTPTPWAAYSFAPAEAVVEAGILPLAALIMPLHVVTIVAFMTHMIVRNVLGHAGYEMFPAWWFRVPLLRAITTTTHHDQHHATSRYNYGLYFTWWDRICGTEHPEYRQQFQATVGRQQEDMLTDNR